MTVTTTTTRTPYVGNGITTVFSTAWYFQRDTDVRVTVDGVLKTRGVHYTVQLPPAVDEPGTITFLAPPANTSEVIVERRVPLVQDTSYRAQGSYSRAVQEDSMDRLGFQIQQLGADVATLEAGGDPGIAGDVAQLQDDVAALQTTVAGHTDDITDLDGRVDNLESASAIALSDADPVPVANTASSGDGTTAARFNHQHAHGNQTNPDHHAVATESVNGFASAQLVQTVNALSAEQRMVFDGRTANAAPQQIGTYTPTDNTIERILIEAVATNGAGSLIAFASAVLGDSPTNKVNATYTGNGATTVYVFPWWTERPQSLSVTVNGVNKTYLTDYTVTLPTGATYGFITLGVAAPLGHQVVIEASSAGAVNFVQRIAGATVVAVDDGSGHAIPIRLSTDLCVLIDASSPAVRIRVRGGNYAVRWRVTISRLAVALA